ncbi:hypothetical protein A3E66_02280 [Candidatus Daviesbacteria bacterium RIFCSPHIGHO2_12_FULL_37_16]|uniref:Uncharacterized protein n=3 Tax=Candidatus Daviesiibacteriota TaxID=1752718 RepID=A0A0G0EST4_9BACT|nr:MAG: hypothetical protein US19_C0021G0008 [Candidatus Daviesbacteria bacterium GW2011_GWB1_36_5]KKQ16271.1 MAG: hypothetical protein US28_C0003G0035 [Candidatus Daviesbacteria bacterium GW2011_GWA1_36_8]OGE36737.1 MAG: hypothetical protein A3E66_02280 [Candidatus Daviesbacteria bacterium RIFCSPHIGHO2_12_FULL_37_16]
MPSPEVTTKNPAISYMKECVRACRVKLSMEEKMSRGGMRVAEAGLKVLVEHPEAALRALTVVPASVAFGRAFSKHDHEGSRNALIALGVGMIVHEVAREVGRAAEFLLEDIIRTDRPHPYREDK